MILFFYKNKFYKNSIKPRRLTFEIKNFLSHLKAHKYLVNKNKNLPEKLTASEDLFIRIKNVKLIKVGVSYK